MLLNTVNPLLRQGAYLFQTHLRRGLIETGGLPYYRKLTLHEIKVLEINANLMENDFRIKKINAKEEVEFHFKGN